jgi:DNA topoisomerase-1
MNNPYPPSAYQWRELKPGEKRVTGSGQPIAPAYTRVYLNKDKSAKLEAVAKDAKGRTVSIYTKKHRIMADSEKFRRIDRMDSAYPRIMSHVQKHLPKVEEAKVLYLIDKTRFRVGGEGDTLAEKKAYGATTLLKEHVKVEDDDLVKFNFVGKKGVTQSKIVRDPVLAKIIRERRNRERLFDTDEGHVLSYLRTLPYAKDLKVSDFRPYYATKMAKEMMASMPVPKTKKDLKQAKKVIAEAVSEDLGNTPSVAMNSYIDPRIWKEWDKSIPETVKRKVKRKKK